MNFEILGVAELMVLSLLFEGSRFIRVFWGNCSSLHGPCFASAQSKLHLKVAHVPPLLDPKPYKPYKPLEL